MKTSIYMCKLMLYTHTHTHKVKPRLNWKSANFSQDLSYFKVEQPREVQTFRHSKKTQNPQWILVIRKFQISLPSSLFKQINYNTHCQTFNRVCKKTKSHRILRILQSDIFHEQIIRLASITSSFECPQLILSGSASKSSVDSLSTDIFLASASELELFSLSSDIVTSDGNRIESLSRSSCASNCETMMLRLVLPFQQTMAMVEASSRISSIGLFPAKFDIRTPLKF